MNINNYKSYLSQNGKTIGEIRKHQTDNNINSSFLSTPEYKRAYILGDNGWEWVDIQFTRHVKESVSADDSDYYVKFRPLIHFKVGSYIIIPDDSGIINLKGQELNNPFLQEIKERTQWWILVKRSKDNYVKYEVLQCNYNFRWLYNGKIQENFGIVRNQNSYTSGVWANDKGVYLDELNGAWLSDTYNVYGNRIKEYGLSDTRTLSHEQRIMVTENDLFPKCYLITKVNDLSPKGIIKISYKQDDYNEKRDNVALHICDYYSDSGLSIYEPSDETIKDETKSSYLVKMFINSNNELEIDHPIQKDSIEEIEIGNSYYFNVVLNTEQKMNMIWNIDLLTKDNLTEKEIDYYEKLLKVTEFDEITVLLKISKANSLKGKKFLLSVCNEESEYFSSVILEVK